MKYQLEGITHQPLGNYLAGLGVMSIVERYIDPNAQFHWIGLEFWVETIVPQSQLVPKILSRLEASPLFTPWNASCGIAIDKSTGNLSYTDSIEQMMESDSWRTDNIRALIPQFRQLINEAKVATKSGYTYPKDREKETFILNCLDSISDDRWQSWANTVIVPVDSYGQISIKYPKLLGTMGNIGAVDIAENYHTAFGLLFDPDGDPTDIADKCFAQIIFNVPSEHKIQSGSVKGIHLFPHQDFNLDRARSQNYDYPPSGVGSTATINPAAVLLATEGLLTFGGLCTPLTPNDRPTGRSVAKYSLAVATTGATIDLVSLDERKNHCEEYFLPLWTQPHTHSLLTFNLFTSPLATAPQFYLQAQIYDATDYITALRAWATTNCLAGKFARYALLTRKSRFDNFAILLEVLDLSLDAPRALQGIDLAADLDAYRLDIRALAKSPKTPNLAQAMCYDFDRLFDKFTIGKATHSDLLLALGKIARYLPPRPLRFDWVKAALAESNCAEFRLAVTLNSCGIPIDPMEFQAADPIGLLLKIQAHWTIAAQRGQAYYLTPHRIFASFADILTFIRDDTFNDRKFIAWIWGLKCVNFNINKNQLLNFTDSYATISHLPVLYRVAAIHLKEFTYRQSPVARVASNGDLQTPIAQLKGTGIQLSSILNSRFTADKRAASALAFPIGDWHKKLLVRSLRQKAFPRRSKNET
ncbi:hypothetical protein [Chamaesiphon sp.]|uniref:hypothetical protein n=1 Tax=Chamaesiphon sp. TaxID=2814140 RepID=UPI0035947972